MTANSYQITLKPSNHTFICKEDETILDAALSAGFNLPYGCQDGACGSCKGTILSGKVNYGRYHEGALSETERNQGRALFCTATPLEDIVIEAKNISALKDIVIKTLPCRVQELKRVSEDVIVLRLRLPANEKLVFLAGQYIDILTKDGKRRSFSLANAPYDNQFVELHIRNIQGGNFTRHVFEEMKERDILRFEGPLGQFYLRENSDKPIIFVATGTGFAPVKSILEYAFSKGIDRQIVLYWGARHVADMYMKEIPSEWQTQYDNFTFIPVLSEPKPEDHWNGRTGLVHDAVLNDFESLANYEVYACGSPLMINAAVKSFSEERQLPLESFFSDAFTLSPDSSAAKRD